MEKIKKLQGKVIDIERTGEFRTDKEGEKWERCIFNIEITNFSKRTPNEIDREGTGVKRAGDESIRG